MSLSITILCAEDYFGQLCDVSCPNVSNGCHTCLPGYTGEFCHEDIDECDVVDCNKNGKCINRVGSYSCSCFQGYTGLECEAAVDYCETEPCRNGSCISLVDTFECECSVGFGGELCDKEQGR